MAGSRGGVLSVLLVSILACAALRADARQPLPADRMLVSSWQSPGSFLSQRMGQPTGTPEEYATLTTTVVTVPATTTAPAVVQLAAPVVAAPVVVPQPPAAPAPAAVLSPAPLVQPVVAPVVPEATAIQSQTAAAQAAQDKAAAAQAAAREAEAKAAALEAEANRAQAEAAAAQQAAASSPCSAQCEEQRRIWAEEAKAKQLRLQTDMDRTYQRFSLETQQLSDEVKNKVAVTGNYATSGLANGVVSAIGAETNAFKQAVAYTGQQAIAAERARFDEVARHQNELAMAVQQGIVKHGYKVAAEVTAQEAKRAGEKFKTFEHKIAGSFEKVHQAWNNSFKKSEYYAKSNWKLWSLTHKSLSDTWANITGSFSKTNAAAAVAQGLGPDIRWISQAVRMQADLAQASGAEAHTELENAVEAKKMAEQASELVKGNSDNLVKLGGLLDEVQTQVNEAGVAATAAPTS